MQFGPIGKTQEQLASDASSWQLLGVLGSMLTELKKIVFHIGLGTDIDLKDQDVGG